MANEIKIEDAVAAMMAYNAELGKYGYSRSMSRKESSCLDVFLDAYANLVLERNAYKAKCEAMRTAIKSAVKESADIRKAIREGKVEDMVTIENSFYVIQDNLEMALEAMKSEQPTGEED